MEEEVVARAGNKDDIINIKSAQYNRFQCTNCSKRKIHCIAGGKKGKPVEMLKDRCSNDECECRCRTHYIANNGKLRKYDTIDDTDILEGMSDGKIASGDIIAKLNKKWRKSHV